MSFCRKKLWTDTESESGNLSPSQHSHSERPVELTQPQDLSFNIRALRLEVTNWQYPWGAESTWERTFNQELAAAREDGQKAVNRFFLDLETHVREGWDILTDLKFVAEVSVNNTADEIRDLFLQGYGMVMTVALEVKFFEVKLDEYAPAVPSTQMCNIRHHSGM